MNIRLIKKLSGLALGFAIIAGGTMAIEAAPTYAAESASATAANILATGEKYMGVPYQYGAASGRTDRFDCSSFTQYVYGQYGIKLPRSSKQQSAVGTYVPRDQLQPGDLVFFYSPIHHVAIYMGDGKLLHTYGKDGVTVTDLTSGWWNSHYATARRVLPANDASVKVTAPADANDATADAGAPTDSGNNSSAAAVTGKSDAKQEVAAASKSNATASSYRQYHHHGSER